MVHFLFELQGWFADFLWVNLARLATVLSFKTLVRFGPVNLFWSTRYDKAMTFFLACLKEFAEFANAKDRAANVPLDKCFQLPYKIENDKVEGFTITQSFNRQEKWTKALKYTLCNLKWALYWLIGNTAFQPASPASSSMAIGTSSSHGSSTSSHAVALQPESRIGASSTSSLHSHPTI